MKAICSHPRCSNFNQILIFFCFSQSYTSQELWIFEKNCSVQPFCIMCHSIIRAVNDDNEGCLFPAMHTVPKIQTLSKYRYFFVTVKVIHPKYYEYSKKKLLSTAILHHVSQHHQSRQRQQKRTLVPSHACCSKNTNWNKILFFFVTVKVIYPKYYKYLFGTAI